MTVFSQKIDYTFIYEDGVPNVLLTFTERFRKEFDPLSFGYPIKISIFRLIFQRSLESQLCIWNTVVVIFFVESFW